MITPKLETDRLMLREICSDDVDAIFNCWMQDENVSRYMCWKASEDINETKNFVEFELACYFSILTKSTGTFPTISERSSGAEGMSQKQCVPS